MLYDAEVKQRAEMGMNASFSQLVFGFLLAIPVLTYYGLVPSAFALVGLPELEPLSIDGRLGFGIGLPSFPRYWLCNQTVPGNERV